MTVNETTCKRCGDSIQNDELKDDLKKFDHICCNCITAEDRIEVMNILTKREVTV